MGHAHLNEAMRRGQLDERAYTHLLFAIVAVYAGNPLIETLIPREWDALVRLISGLLSLAVLLFAVRVTAVCSGHYRLALAGAVVAAGLQIVYEFTGLDWTLVGNHLILVLVLLRATFSLGGYLARATRVNVHTIMGAISFYLLVSLQFAFFYSALSLVDPGAFTANDALAGVGARVEMGTSASSYALYFSIITMTTLGYGDISPVSELARSTAGLQAIFGQFYLAIVVARLVSLYSRSEQTAP